MFALQRQQRIAEQVRADSHVAVAHLAGEFGSSQDTIRRNLAAPKKSGGIKRVYGGILDAAERLQAEQPMAPRAVPWMEEKRSIAQAALAQLSDRGTTLLEFASTSLVPADMLPDRFGAAVVTDGIEIAHHLATRGFEVVMVGGRVCNRSLATLDDWVHPALAGLRSDVAILGRLGLTTHAGLTAPDMSDAAIKRRCLEVAERNVLLDEAAKHGVVAPYRYAHLTDFDLLITDAGLDGAVGGKIRSMGSTSSSRETAGEPPRF